jgi:hypothetical protein
MEQVRQLLMAGNFKVGEVMQQVGLRDRKSFATAFRKKWGRSFPNLVPATKPVETGLLQFHLPSPAPETHIVVPLAPEKT